MSKFGLIQNLEEDKASPKTKFQLFEVELGFERAEILIPFVESDAFCEAANNAKPKSKSSLKKLVKRFGGEVL
jgi:hypothetical protein